jgi:hypothetical protein
MQGNICRPLHSLCTVNVLILDSIREEKTQDDLSLTDHHVGPTIC